MRDRARHVLRSRSRGPSMKGPTSSLANGSNRTHLRLSWSRPTPRPTATSEGPTLFYDKDQALNPFIRAGSAGSQIVDDFGEASY